MACGLASDVGLPMVVVTVAQREEDRPRSETVLDEARRLVAPYEEVAAELASEVTDDEWANVPTDLASNLDYYLYDIEGQREMEGCNGMTK